MTAAGAIPALELGTIEGFYGRPWTWEQRTATMQFLAGHGYGFYMYAPKADTYLRRRWMEPHPDAAADSLQSFGDACRAAGVRFGVGLSPYDAFLDWSDDARAAFARKLAFLDEIGADDVAILFDDMRGDVPRLAETQAEIVDWCASRTNATRLIVCPSYYSDDPVLDRVFGDRPGGYLRTLGRLVDPKVHFFWTGPEVCSRELTRTHLERVADEIGRRPFLWDNYPVNDGQRMSQFLHVRGFTGRRQDVARIAAAHGVNPALQPVLTRVPMLTLTESYTLGDGYEYTLAQQRAAAAVLGEELGRMLCEDTLFLQDVGLDSLGPKEQVLRERWTGVDHHAAREIIDWLDGGYRITDEIVHTQ